MGEFKVTFDDGSEAYLVHFGVQGMKWGVWNAETAARYAGGKSKRTLKYMSKAEKHRAAANDFRARRDAANTAAINARAKGKKYSIKSARAEQGAELFRNANPKRAAKFSKKADKQNDLYESSSSQAEQLNKKYIKSDRKATKYEVKAYKSDAKDSYVDVDRKTVKALKKGRISLKEATDKTNEKVQATLDQSKNSVFVSGSSKTQAKKTETGEKNPYYRKNLPKEVRRQLDDYMRRGDKILVGDAPGIDRQTQDYLASKGYRNVEVFSPQETRYLANKNWRNTRVEVPGSEPGSKEWLAGKDKVMTDRANEGLAVTITDGSSATRRNIERLASQGKPAVEFEISKDGKRRDSRVK